MVVAVVALLIAVLLPALSGVRARGQRSMCAANLRSMHAAYSIYAMDFDQRVPLGFNLGPAPGWKQYNYLVRSSPSSGEPAWRWGGLIYLHGTIDAPEAAYCPSETDDLFGFNTADNPWPPDASAPAGKSTRFGYGTRPLVGWPFPRELEMPGGMPRLDRIGVGSAQPRIAMLADLMHKPDRVAERHGDIVQVVYVDSSVGSVGVEQLETAQVDSVRWLDTLDEGFDTRFNRVFMRDDIPPAESFDSDDRSVWQILDRPD